MTQATSYLDDLGELPAGFAHVSKQAHPGKPLSLPEVYLKWYDLRDADQPATPQVSDEARDFLAAESAAGRLDFKKGFGFVILHKDGAKFFMIVNLWHEDERWQGIFFKDQQGFQVYPLPDGVLRPTQCIVELDITAHERRAWSRYLHSARDTAAKQTYAHDLMSGQVS